MAGNDEKSLFLMYVDGMWFLATDDPKHDAEHAREYRGPEASYCDAWRNMSGLVSSLKGRKWEDVKLPDSILGYAIL